MDTREAALTVLMDIEENQTFSNLALGNALRKYQFEEKTARAFLTRLVEGVVEMRLRLDYVINQYSKTKIQKCKPMIACLLRMGCYQILFMDRVPDSAACNESVKLAKKHGFYGLSGFINGVLRTIAREKEHLQYPDETKELVRAYSVWSSTPEWLVEKLVADYGSETAKEILYSSLKDRKTSVRLNLSEIKRQQETKETYKKRLEQAGITVEAGAYYEDAWLLSGYDFIHRIPGYKQGFFTVQDESSMCAVETAAIQAEDLVLDLCAAPGGKTTAAAAYAYNGTVVSMDIAQEKLSLIEENVTRLQLKNVTIRCQDATVRMEDYIARADVVIADLPCSGLGIMGRKNDIKYRMTKEQIAELVTLQHTILQNAAEYVKPGGTLLYSTCTITKEENDMQMERFQKEHPEFQLRKKRQFLQGVDACDGFYYAVWKKK